MPANVYAPLWTTVSKLGKPVSKNTWVKLNLLLKPKKDLILLLQQDLSLHQLIRKLLREGASTGDGYAAGQYEKLMAAKFGE